MSSTDQPVVLAVDDDDDLRTTYELWLDDDWEIRTAAHGEEALAVLDSDVDVVLLDRMMPGLSGREVLTRIRDRPVDPQVVMVTAVDPETDVVEMPFDAYVIKPIDRDELDDTVRTMLERSSFDERLQEYFALVEKRATLEAEKPDELLAADERYRKLDERIDELEAELDEQVVAVDDDEFVARLDDVV